MPATLHETPAERSAEPKIIYTPLTLEEWATHYGVGTKELGWAMRTAMTRIFGEDKEVMRNEGNERALRARKASLRELHRGEIKDAGITLSQPFQERVRALLEREVPTPASEYFTLKQMKLKFPKVNFNELTKISERIRANHPEWYCRTKNVNGGRPSFSLLRTFEREFITAANELIEEWILPRRYGGSRSTPPASTEVKQLVGWGMDDARVVAAEISGWGRESYE